ncbi:hypothetical protein TrLO_g14495 [Triparma laevis f. longispina]|uniref:Methyltransferase domain-containing protein n=1 Tax=Triparma laevis f. longispina TaxID=1714387 RepID=A0A9W7E5B8_9STRA|nr:hypothetical protein TrLO_g14495 [Triparma laevis f. longispina]
MANCDAKGKNVPMKQKFNRLDCTNSLEDAVGWCMSPVVWCFLSIISPFLFLMKLVTDKLLFFMVGRNVIYNVNWEDPRVEREVLNLNESDNVITIASAGCNSLDYIIDGAQVTACDLNDCQIALCEIKVAAAKILTYEEFFSIFASNDCDFFREIYPKRLRHMLTAPSASFWDEKIKGIDSFMYFGASGGLAYVAFRIFFPMIGLGWIRNACAERMPPNEFQGIIDVNKIYIKTAAWLIKKVLEPFAIAFAGVPLRQIQLGNKRHNTWLTVFENIIYRTDFCGDNYFYNGYILGYFDKHCCPNYLKEENFATMQKNLKKGNLTLYTGTIEGFLKENMALKAANKPFDTFTVASLLDHMDWMPHEWINSEISILMKNMDPANGRVFWRSFANDVHSPILQHLNPVEIDQYPEVEGAHAGQYAYHSCDRVGMYFSSWIANISDCGNTIEPRSVSWDSDATTFDTSFFTTLKTGFKIVSFPIKQAIGLVETKKDTANGHGKNIEAFYQDQASVYDSFRENFLHARCPMLTCIPTKTVGDMVWIDVGGGTARNLEFIPVDVLKKKFKKIIVVDISPSLLEVAKARVAKHGLSDVVECVCCDFTDEKSVKKHLPKAGTVDIVTFSYSLSMIPNKKCALENAQRLLKSKGDGCLGVADFFERSGREHLLQYPIQLLRWLESKAHKYYFRCDGVHLLTDEVFESGLDESMSKQFEEKFRGSVPLLPILRPYQGFAFFEKN